MEDAKSVRRAVWGPSQGHRRRRRRSRARGAGRVLAKDLPSLPVPARALLYPGPRRPAHMATPTASLPISGPPLSCPSSSKPAPTEVDAETAHAARLPPDPLGPQADSPGRRAWGLESASQSQLSLLPAVPRLRPTENTDTQGRTGSHFCPSAATHVPPSRSLSSPVLCSTIRP